MPADYSTIQTGIDAARSGDTVVVAPGEYVITTPIDFRGRWITVVSETGPEETVIKMSDRLSDLETTSVVVFISGERNESVLSGFTITGGKGNKWYNTGGWEEELYVIVSLLRALSTVSLPGTRLTAWAAVFIVENPPRSLPTVP